MWVTLIQTELYYMYSSNSIRKDLQVVDTQKNSPEN